MPTTTSVNPTTGAVTSQETMWNGQVAPTPSVAQDANAQTVAASSPIPVSTTAPTVTMTGSAAQADSANNIAPYLASQQQAIATNKADKTAAATATASQPPKTQQQLDAASGYHNVYGYDQNTGARLGATPQNSNNGMSPDVASLANTPEQGQMFAYQKDGTKLEIPIGTTPEQYGLLSAPPVVAGQSVSNAGGVNVGTAVPLDQNGQQIAQLGNGTYAVLDSNANFVRNITQDQYNNYKTTSQAYKVQVETQAKNEASAALDKVQNGTYPLNQWQQDQINNIKADYADLIAKQNIANANLTGGTTVMQGLLGMSQYSPGSAQGAIAQVVNDGVTKINKLQSQMAADIGKMTMAFQQQNFDNLKAIYDIHQKNVENAQSEIDAMQKSVADALEKQRNYDLKVAEDKQAAQDKADQLAFDKIKQDDTKSYQQKQLDLQYSQLSETAKHNRATEFEAEQKRIADATKGKLDANTPFASTITNAVLHVPQNQKDGVIDTLKDTATKKDWTNLKVQLGGLIRDNLPTAEARNTFTSAEKTIGFLNSIEPLIQEYQKNNGDMGYLKGSYADIMAKLGQLSTDEKFRDIATQMQINFSQFRNQMTGAAFSPNESNDYQKLVPAENKNFDLNFAVINGARNYAQNQLDTLASGSVGEGYKQLQGVVESESKINNYLKDAPLSNQLKISQMESEGSTYSDIIAFIKKNDPNAKIE